MSNAIHLEVSVEMWHGVAVAVPAEPVPVVTVAEVEALRRLIRNEREGGFRSSVWRRPDWRSSSPSSL